MVKKWTLQKVYPGTELGRGTVISQLTSELTNLDPQSAWVVTVDKQKRWRTNDQNRKLHAMIAELADEIGYTAGEMKRLLKNEIGAYQIIDGPCGKIKRFESSADWNTERMAEAIEQLHRWGAEVGHRWSAEP